MPESKQTDEQEAPEPQRPGQAPQNPQPQPMDVGAAVRSILSEMAQSGELLGGGGGDEEPGHGAPPSPSGSFDLRGAIREALAEERAQGEQERERKTLNDRLERLENPPKKRQWGKPWSPFGG